MEETFWKEQPWMVLRYTRTDAEADAAGGMQVVIECCMCGREKVFEFPILPPDWQARGINDVEFYATSRAEGETYMREQHMHRELHGKPPGLFWAKPLRNPDAWHIDWAQIAQRIRSDLDGMEGSKS